MNKLSIVIPAYNSQDTIAQVVNKVESSIEALKKTFEYEIIIVNDCSKDNTLNVCIDIAQSNGKVKFFNFSKNFGQHSALMAGFRAVTGDYIICLDDDLQTPPEEIKTLISSLENNNYDVVYAYYENKMHSKIRNQGSRLNDLMATVLINKPKDLKVSSYFIARRFVIDEVIKYDKPYPYILGLILRVTQNIGNICVPHNERKTGKSNYSFTKLIKLWMNGFTNFSVKPLRVSALFGVLFAVLGFVFVIALIIQKLLVPETQIGWTSIMTSIVFLGGVQLMSVGLLGEYIGRIYLSINNTPQYVIKDVHDVNKSNEER